MFARSGQGVVATGRGRRAGDPLVLRAVAGSAQAGRPVDKQRPGRGGWSCDSASLRAGWPGRRRPWRRTSACAQAHKAHRRTGARAHEHI